MKGAKGLTGKDYLAAAERNLKAARGQDERTGAALERYARNLMLRAQDALLVERGGGQAVPIT